MSVGLNTEIVYISKILVIIIAIIISWWSQRFHQTKYFLASYQHIGV